MTHALLAVLIVAAAWIATSFGLVGLWILSCALADARTRNRADDLARLEPARG